MQGIPGDIVRKITGHRSRELERYQHLSPLFRAQTVDLIAQVLVGDTPTDTPAPDEEQDDAKLFETGGVVRAVPQTRLSRGSFDQEAEDKRQPDQKLSSPSHGEPIG